MHLRGTQSNFQSNQLWLVEEDILLRLHYLPFTLQTTNLKALTSKTGISVFKPNQITSAISSSIPDPTMIISQVKHNDQYAVLILLRGVLSLQWKLESCQQEHKRNQRYPKASLRNMNLGNLCNCSWYWIILSETGCMVSPSDRWHLNFRRPTPSPQKHSLTPACNS